MDIINNINFILQKSQAEQYGVKNISIQLSETDEKINTIIDYCKNIKMEEKDKIRKLMTTEMAWLLLCFGIRMATYSLRLSNQDYFINGLIAISMTLGILDQRELLVVLSLYCDVQKKCKLSFDQILKRHDEFSFLLKSFNNREEKDKSIECMGYILALDENDNPTYQKTW